MYTFKCSLCVNLGRHLMYTSNRKIHHRKLTNIEVQKKRVNLFEKEQARQAAFIVDINKIEVKYVGQPEDCTLIMNKCISTPYNCVQHLTELIRDRAVLAEVNGKVWDMHYPLEEDCTLRFLHFKEDDPYYVNKAFWRSASIMLGAVLETAFKDHHSVELCSFPSPNVRSGSFVYDVDLKIPNWIPSKEELRVLSSEMVKLSLAKLKFERLEVDIDIAIKIFEDNCYKKAQVPDIAAQNPNGNKVALYRVGNFIDMSRGPLISDTRHLGKTSITSVHPITTDLGEMYRVQGLALPKGILLNHFTYGILQERSSKLNPGRLPCISSFNNQIEKYSSEVKIH